MADPLLRKRRQRAPIGYEVVQHLCLDCAGAPPPATEPLREGGDAGRPFVCAKCNRPLRPARTQGQMVDDAEADRQAARDGYNPN